LRAQEVPDEVDVQDGAGLEMSLMVKSARKTALPPRLNGLAPLTSASTVLLVLGSFPGAASLAAGRYYAHPQNQFWRILQAIWPSSPLQPLMNHYQICSNSMLSHGLGLWDVYASCEREGSLDADIRHPQVNDLAGLASRLPALRAIAHNGGESFRHARITRALGLPVHRLPSTSAANASWSFERKLQAWRALFQQVGIA